MTSIQISLPSQRPGTLSVVDQRLGTLTVGGQGPGALTIGTSGMPGPPGPAGPAGTGSGLSANHRDRPANITAANGDALIASALGDQPLGAIFVLVNGLDVGAPSYGTKTGAVWFSNDNGATSALRSEVHAGSTVHFNPAVAGYATTSTDKVSLIYEV